METVSADMIAVGGYVIPDEKSNAAYDNQGHDHDIYKRVIIIPGKRSIGGVFSHQIESGIAECGNGVEDSIIDSLSPSHLFLEAKRQKRGSDSFKQEGSQHDLFCQPDNSSNLQNVDALLQRPPHP